MADCVKTLQVRLQQDGFCVATGPRDSAIDYPCPVEPFAPVLLGSPVVLHVYCPDLFPGEVLKVHAEHLGHFTGIRNVPRVNDEHERALFSGLCGLFGRERVIGVYDETLVDGSLREEVKKARSRGSDDGAWPKVFVAFQSENRDRARQTLALLRKLTRLFDLNELRDADIPYVRGQEPAHMLFLYAIQLTALFLSSCADERILATIMSVASAPFLEANFCDPLCAATLLKPMFLPWYESLPRKADEADQGVDPETKLQYYRLFTGYEIGNDGTCASGDSRDDLAWTGNSVQLRARGYKIEESSGKALWFVAPQAGDRLRMTRESGLRRMAGAAGEHADLIRSYLMCDNVMAYLQCALFGTIRCMLPCHANSEFSESVMELLGRSVSKFADELRHQSADMFSRLKTEGGRGAANCLYVSGVGFAGQSEGKSLYFGKIFTGPEDKKPPPKYKTTFGDFATVTMGVSTSTEMLSMLDVALAPGKKDKGGGASLRATLSKAHRPAGIQRVAMDASLYARYHHRFNTGEFTEVACVKAMSDPMYSEKIHKDALTEKSEYRLCLAHGALPMCVLTLCMTMRQTVMISLGLFCTELARSVYAASKLNYSTLCARLVTMATVTKFRHKKDSDETNVFNATYGETLKLTSPAFSKAGSNAVNYSDLDDMEWLGTDDRRLPCHVRTSLAMIGDTKAQVQKIMQQHGLCYNRVVFTGEGGVLRFSDVFANEEYMIEAPVTISSSIRLFSNTKNSFGSLKLCKRGCYYTVAVLSNKCVDTSQYIFAGGSKDPDPVTDRIDKTVEGLVERIKREVSRVLPRIDVGRIKMMAPDLSEQEFDALVSAVKGHGIEVTGRKDKLSFRGAEPASREEKQGDAGPARPLDDKRKREGPAADLGAV
ncbi:hypothetical protein Q5P01_000212 [Channa striata]|uniref:Uncharacterized protein n=1 Tax=Channa striata TaxID=64152 RepID=A0AA88LIE2_CHASR|nr:hypothetical protein Q5P01_000212 [Channa striata]